MGRPAIHTTDPEARRSLEFLFADIWGQFLELQLLQFLLPVWNLTFEVIFQYEDVADQIKTRAGQNGTPCGGYESQRVLPVQM